MGSKLKKAIIWILVLVISFGIYYFFFKGSDSDIEDYITSTGSPQEAADVLGQEILIALNQIEALKLDRSIFEDPVYLSLTDRSEEIDPEPVGRVNPFAPIGDEPVGSSSSSDDTEEPEGESDFFL